MASIKSILTDIQTLPLNQIEELLSHLEEFLVLGYQVEKVCDEVKEFRFAKGKVCPHCNSESISRNGGVDLMVFQVSIYQIICNGLSG